MHPSQIRDFSEWVQELHHQSVYRQKITTPSVRPRIRNSHRDHHQDPHLVSLICYDLPLKTFLAKKSFKRPKPKSSGSGGIQSKLLEIAGQQPDEEERKTPPPPPVASPPEPGKNHYSIISSFLAFEKRPSYTTRPPVQPVQPAVPVSQ